MSNQAENEVIKSAIYIASFAIFIMVFFIILFVIYYQRKQAQQKIALQELEAEMQRQLLENSLEVQEIERRRIAKDLHDDVGAMLSATKMSLNQLSKKAVGQEPLVALAQNTKNMLEESIGQVRRISKELVPTTLENFGLVIALEEFIDKLIPISEIDFEVNHTNLAPEERFDKKIELTIYRIAQELVNNSLKHAAADKIKLDLLKNEKNFIFNYSDNGKGFNYESTLQDSKSGLGIRNIQSRLSVIAGNLEVLSALGEGMKVNIEIPLPATN